MGKIQEMILEKIKNGEFFLSIHAQERMSERDVVVGDIINVALTAKNICWQSERLTYLIEGFDLLSNELNVVVGIEDNVIIVTVFYRGDHE